MKNKNKTVTECGHPTLWGWFMFWRTVHMVAKSGHCWCIWKRLSHKMPESFWLYRPCLSFKLGSRAMG